MVGSQDVLLSGYVVKYGNGARSLRKYCGLGKPVRTLISPQVGTLSFKNFMYVDPREGVDILSGKIARERGCSDKGWCVEIVGSRRERKELGVSRDEEGIAREGDAARGCGPGLSELGVK